MQAATINGSIHHDPFVGEKNAIIVVLDEEDQVFTRLEATNESDTDPTGFTIFWLVPNKSY
jgi:hypothetical protein